MSASIHWTPWNFPTGWPNCWRCLTYPSVESSAERLDPAPHRGGGEPLVHDEEREALHPLARRGGGGEDHEVGEGAVGDEHLGPRDPVASRRLLGPARDGAGVGPGPRLGEGPRADILPPAPGPQ